MNHTLGRWCNVGVSCKPKMLQLRGVSRRVYVKMSVVRSAGRHQKDVESFWRAAGRT